jgi:hypothetical protein
MAHDTQLRNRCTGLCRPRRKGVPKSRRALDLCVKILHQAKRLCRTSNSHVTADMGRAENRVAVRNALPQEFDKRGIVIENSRVAWCQIGPQPPSPRINNVRLLGGLSTPRLGGQ